MLVVRVPLFGGGRLFQGRHEHPVVVDQLQLHRTCLAIPDQTRLLQLGETRSGAEPQNAGVLRASTLAAAIPGATRGPDSLTICGHIC